MDLYQLNGVSRTSQMNSVSRVGLMNGVSRVGGSQINAPEVIYLPGGVGLNGKGKDRRSARRAARKGKKLARVDRREIRKTNRQERGEIRMQKRRDGTSFLDTFGKSLSDISSGIGAEKMAGAEFTQAEAAMMLAEQAAEDLGGAAGRGAAEGAGGAFRDWMSDNWYYVAGGGAALALGIYFATKKPKSKRRR